MFFPHIFHQWQALFFYALCVVALVQIFYYLFFFTKLANYKPRPKTTSIKQPVSVIVCARDAANNLEKNLPDVLLQDYPFTNEIIVVNDNSNDDTKFFLEEMEKAFKQLRSLNLTQEAVHIPGKKFPLSMGIKTAKNELLLLTDADCIPASNQWMNLMQDAYTDGKEIVLGYGAFHKTKGLLNKLVRFETFHAAMQYFSFALRGRTYMGVGRNLSYKKDLFYRNKGFSSMNNIPGGDDDLFINKVATKNNVAIVIDKLAFTFSDAPENFYKWWRQKSRHYSTSRFYKFSHKLWLGFYSATHFLFYPLLAATAIIFNWELALGVYLLRLIIQGIVWYKCMKKLDEADLFPMFWLLDIWQFFYYIIFSITLIKKPRSTWG